MKNATVHKSHLINEFELFQTCNDFESKHPNTLYSVSPGNDCVWVNYGRINLYYIFREGKISEIQVD